MKKIAFVLGENFFPVPALFGGAVEELLTMLANENEKNKKFEFTFVQPIIEKNKLNQIKNTKYSYSNFVFLNKNKIAKFFTRAWNKVFKTKKSMPYENNLLKFVSKENFDYVIFENFVPKNIEKFAEKIDKEKLYYHCHNQIKEKDALIKSINNIISVSQFIENKWKEAIGNLTGYNLNVLNNAVNEKKFNKSVSDNEKNQIKTKLGFSKDDFVVLFCGRVIEEKGVLELMSAVTQTNNNKIKLLIVGSPNFSRNTESPYLLEVEKLVNKYSNIIKFTGYVDHAQLYKYYKSSDLQIVPSVWDDPAPLVVIEGIVSGCAQICTISGGVPEYVCDEGCILLDKNVNLVKNLKTNIIKLSQNKKLCETMQKANAQHGKNFTTVKYYNDFVKIIEKNIKHKKG